MQLDGKYPNLALMKLAHFHRQKGDRVHLTRRIYPELFEPHYDLVYASAIFGFSAAALAACQKEWPQAILGGTGTSSAITVEQIIGADYENYDYSDYGKFKASIGFTQRGCRMAKSAVCQKFCVVPKKEGYPRPLNTIDQIWRGDPWPKKLLLLDNDFFGNPLWRPRLQEIREGKFRVCFSQGINSRLINQESAEALATIRYRNSGFNERKLYTAWDNFGEERIFFNGVERLERAGIPPSQLMAYMLTRHGRKHVLPVKPLTNGVPIAHRTSSSGAPIRTWDTFPASATSLAKPSAPIINTAQSRKASSMTSSRIYSLRKPSSRSQHNR